MWSCAGDLIIAAPQYFYCGVFCFLIAHFMYIGAFGLGWARRRLALVVALLFYAAIVLPLLLCSASITDPFYVVAIFIYTGALVAMSCSAMAHLLSRVRQLDDRAVRRRSPKHHMPISSDSDSDGVLKRWLSRPKSDLASAVRVCTAFGALLFVCSDVCLAWDRNVRPLPVLRALVMPTYYAAQLGIALAVADPQLTSSRSHSY